MRKVFSLVLALALLATPIHAGAVEITLLHGWGTMEAEHVAMREIYARFMQTRPDVTLTLVSLPDTEQALAKAADMLAVGEAPDLLFMAGVRSALLDFMIDKGYALNLAPYLARDAQLRACVSPFTLDVWAGEDGALYTVTDVMWLNGLWLNQRLLEQAGVDEAPRTWDAFFAACDRIARWSAESGRDVDPIALTPEDAANLLQFILPGLDAGGSQGGDRLEDALAILARLFDYAGDASLGYRYRDTLSLFNQERTVFYVNGIWASGMIGEGIDARCVAFPGEIGTVSGQSASCGYVLGNTGDTARMEASVAFIKYMLSQATQEEILLTTGQFPSNPQVRFEALTGVSERFIDAARAIQSADVCTSSLGLRYDEKQTEALTEALGDYLTRRLSASETAERIRAIEHR